MSVRAAEPRARLRLQHPEEIARLRAEAVRPGSRLKEVVMDNSSHACSANPR
jgi:hypothetical protein